LISWSRRKEQLEVEPMAGDGIVVVGGGIAGITAAVEVAEVGFPVDLVELAPYLGGRVIRSNRYFPKMCPPQCGLEINFRRIRKNPRVRVHTMTRVTSIEGKKGDFKVQVKVSPRFVNSKCTACGACEAVCPVERPNDFNYGLDKTKAIYLPHEMAFPNRYVIDPSVCLGKDCGKCVEVCPFGAIDLDMKEQVLTLNAGAIIWATGWDPYDASRIDYYGFGKNPNLINNVMMERLSAVGGPTGGKISRLSDGGEVRRVAFVQCAGSRDENHLPYCSGVCCSASLKQAFYVREQYPDAEVTIFYIDIRALGRLEDLYVKAKADPKITFVKGKVAEIFPDKATGELILRVEDVDKGEGITSRADLVVLATGIVPTTVKSPVPFEVPCDDYGFLVPSEETGIIPAGCVKKPVDVAHTVQDATGAALSAIQSLKRR
jgi:quinone-modifying oxidoreductase subunit QmoA